MPDMQGTDGDRRMHYRCSFCGKGRDEVKQLIAGPGAVYICDECVELCQGIVAEKDPEARISSPELPPNPVLLHLPVREMMQHPDFVNAAMKAEWMFDIREGGEIHTLIRVKGHVVAQVLESLGTKANDEDIEI